LIPPLAPSINVIRKVILVVSEWQNSATQWKRKNLKYVGKYAESQYNGLVGTHEKKRL
jgi:hypothetical protein